MTLRLLLTDGNGIQGITATFGAFINTQIAATAADAAAAAASAASAGNSASDADGSASAAATSATAAAASAAAASSSAGTATTEAGIATTQAGNAATSATAAAASASAASGSASSSAASASAASGSATAAATSASNAAATLLNALVKANNLSDVSNATTSRTNISAAKSGANSDITSLTGLSTALSVAQGGTGQTTIAAAVAALGLATVTGKNRFINALGLICQRGISTAFAVNAGGYGGPDRWVVNNNASGAAITQSSGTMVINGVTYPCVTQTVATAGTSFTGTNAIGGISQAIEGLNCYDLMGQQASLGFWFQSSTVGQYSASVRNYAATESIVTTFNYAVAGVAQWVPITFPTFPASLAIPISAAGGLTATIAACNQGTYQSAAGHNNAWQSGDFFTSPSDTVWANTIGHYISATMIQLEAGSVCTPFEWKDIDTLIRQCMRYFQVAGCQMVFLYGPASEIGYQDFELYPMRASPSYLGVVGTITYSNASGYAPTPIGSTSYRVSLTIIGAGNAYAYNANPVFQAEL